MTGWLSRVGRKPSVQLQTLVSNTARHEANRIATVAYLLLPENGKGKTAEAVMTDV